MQLRTLGCFNKQNKGEQLTDMSEKTITFNIKKLLNEEIKSNINDQEWVDKYLSKDINFQIEEEFIYEQHIYSILRNRTFDGLVILKDDKPSFILSIYEYYNHLVDEKMGAIAAVGHEDLILLNLNTNEFNETHTR